MELAAGEPLSAERAKLQELQQALGGGLGAATARPAQPGDADELVLASQLDKLEEQLAAVEQQIASADNGAKQLLTAAVSSSSLSGADDERGAHSSASGPPGVDAPAGDSGSAACSHAHGSNGWSSEGGGPTGGTGGGRGCKSSSSLETMTATGLLPITEQAEDGEDDVLAVPDDTKKAEKS